MCLKADEVINLCLKNGLKDNTYENVGAFKLIKELNFSNRKINWRKKGTSFSKAKFFTKRYEGKYLNDIFGYNIEKFTGVQDGKSFDFYYFAYVQCERLLDGMYEVDS